MLNNLYAQISKVYCTLKLAIISIDCIKEKYGEKKFKEHYVAVKKKCAQKCIDKRAMASKKVLTEKKLEIDLD